MSDLFQHIHFPLGLVSGVLVTVVAMFMKKHIERLLDSVLAGCGTFISYRIWQRRYVRFVHEEHKYLKFVGVTHTVPLRRPKLRDVFVNLELQPAPRFERSTPTQKAISLGQAFSLDDAMVKFNYLAILGNPGAGKTTLLEHICCVCCDPASVLSRYIPVFVPLRRCTMTGQSLIEQLTDQSAGFYPVSLLRTYPRGFFEAKMSNGQCLFLLDGMDEVLDETHHTAAARMIETLSAAFPKCPIIVTSRIAGWRNLLSTKFARFVVRDLSRREISGLVKQWYEAVTYEDVRAAADADLTKQQTQDALELAHRQSDAMLGVLESTPRLQQIVCTPLVLSLMCLVYYTQKDLPRKRARLYEECVIILLDEWDRRDKQLQNTTVLGLQNKLALMEGIALKYFDSGLSEMRRSELVNVVEELCRMQGFDSIGGAALAYVEERSGLLSEKSRDVYAFSHLTLQEYFAACALVNTEDGMERLLQRLRSTELHEVVLLYSGIVTSSDSLVSRLLEQYNETDDIRFLLCAGGATAEAEHVTSKIRADATAALANAFDATVDAQMLEQLQGLLADLGISKVIVRRFGEFDVSEEVGRGGEGRIFKAVDRKDNKVVALKVFDHADGEVFSKIKDALTQLRQLRHPQLVNIRDCGLTDDRMFVSMEFVDGPTVDELVSNEFGVSTEVFPQVKTPQERSRHGLAYSQWIVNVLWQVLNPIEYIHSTGLVHGDIKPSNIGWQKDSPILLDFCISMLVNTARSDRRGTITGALYGYSRGFCAPEVIANGNVSQKADVYSLGATAFRMMTGNLYAPGAMTRIPEWVCANEALRHLWVLCGAMVVPDPGDRMSIEEIRVHLEPIRRKLFSV